MQRERERDGNESARERGQERGKGASKQAKKKAKPLRPWLNAFALKPIRKKNRKIGPTCSPANVSRHEAIAAKELFDVVLVRPVRKAPDPEKNSRRRGT